jgi:hypothetical protein
VTDQKDADREVLTSLPRSRPVRRSAKRGERAAAGGATAKAASAKPATGKAAPKKAAPAKAAPRKAAPKAKAAEPAAKPQAAAGAQRAKAPPKRKVPPAGYAAPVGGDPDSSPPGPTEILSTAIQAAGELAQIGFSVGRQAFQAALERLPKP